VNKEEDSVPGCVLATAWVFFLVVLAVLFTHLDNRIKALEQKAASTETAK